MQDMETNVVVVPDREDGLILEKRWGRRLSPRMLHIGVIQAFLIIAHIIYSSRE